MSELYTTGEMAKLCGVTVRTVQYYDTRGILSPSALSEGGRRLYDDDDLRRMKIICFLREIGLSIDTIGQLLREEDPGSVISIFLDQQEQSLRDELSKGHERLEKLSELRKGLRSMDHFTVESIGDVANLMENKNKLRKLHRTMLLTGIPVNLLQWGSILLWIFKGIWWLFVVWAVIAVILGVWVSKYYFQNVAYICPQCHRTFKPTFREAFFARHTPKTRKLTCTQCGHHGFCVEVWDAQSQQA
ncbi:MAG: MerR family transcriptional regulator [Oscillospiraceae bacterium]|nr:MerR family transcriptional regulator [Oscillospiraceae bacterium]